MGLVLTSQSILECYFHTHTDLLGPRPGYIQHPYPMTAALSGTKDENAAFCPKSLPTHGLNALHGCELCALCGL